ncbi:hypothetical protein J3459_011202 [Metarhizium acridum]|nr:hypothetical protein J3459_011202 [Metarhizium acridum]
MSLLAGIQLTTRSFHCDWEYCKKTFTRKSDLQRHYRIHTKERPYVCTTPGCGKSFVQQSALKVHSRIHTGEKPYQCHYTSCGKRFSDCSSLARHRQVHARARPFGHGGYNSRSVDLKTTTADSRCNIYHHNIPAGSTLRSEFVPCLPAASQFGTLGPTNGFFTYYTASNMHMTPQSTCLADSCHYLDHENVSTIYDYYGRDLGGKVVCRPPSTEEEIYYITDETGPSIATTHACCPQYSLPQQQYEKGSACEAMYSSENTNCTDCSNLANFVFCHEDDYMIYRAPSTASSSGQVTLRS